MNVETGHGSLTREVSIAEWTCRTKWWTLYSTPTLGGCTGKGVEKLK